MACGSRRSGRFGEERGTKMGIPASSAADGGGRVVEDGSGGRVREEPVGGGSLTAEQVDTYEEDGYLVLPDLLDDEDLAPARIAMMQKVDQMAADLLSAGLVADPLLSEPFRTRLARLFDGLGEEEFLAYGRSWRDRLPGYYMLMRNPKILDAVESLIGPEIFSNPVYNVRPKVPRVAAGAVPWHQDKSYWPDANSNPVITVWISLVDATLENGCLHMIPRTQSERLLSFGAETYSAWRTGSPGVQRHRRAVDLVQAQSASAVVRAVVVLVQDSAAAPPVWIVGSVLCRFVSPGSPTWCRRS